MNCITGPLKVRGDIVCWVNGDEPGFRVLPKYMKKVDTFVSELGQWTPYCADIRNRSKAMVTCYPGGGAHYVKHWCALSHAWEMNGGWFCQFMLLLLQPPLPGARDYS